MILLLALVVFAGLSAATWFASVVCYHATYGDAPDVNADPNDSTVAAGALAAVALTCLIPVPLGYLAGLIVWAGAAFGFLSLPGAGRGPRRLPRCGVGRQSPRRPGRV